MGQIVAGVACSHPTAKRRAIPSQVPPRRLGILGSIFLTHPSLGDYTATRAELLVTLWSSPRVLSPEGILAEISVPKGCLSEVSPEGMSLRGSLRRDLSGR